MSEKPPHNVWTAPRLVRRRSGDEASTIPRYFLYGDTEAPANWFAHVELLSERCRLSGWQIAAHSHPDFGQLVYVRSGRGVLLVDDRALAFESPCVVLVPPNSVHGFSYEKDTDGWVVTVAEYYMRHLNERLPEFASLWSGPNIYALPREGDEVRDMPASVLKLERELSGRTSNYHIAAEVQLISILLALLRRRSCLTATESQAPSQVRIVEDYRALIERHYQHGWKIGRFASELRVSWAQLRAACDAVTGKTPLKMLQTRVVSEAKRQLIFTDMTVEQIAYWLGFADPAYFNRFFRKEVGTPPAAFRTAMRKAGGPAAPRA